MMTSRLRNYFRLAGLQRALLLYLVIPLLAVAGIGIRVGLDHVADLESDRLKDDVELIGRAIRLPIGEALAVGDRESVQRTLQSVFDIGRVYGASVFDELGVQVAASGITERDLTSSRVAQQVVRTGEQQERYRQVSGLSLYSHFIPVFDELGRTNGFIQINRRASDFDASLLKLSQAAWLIWGVLAVSTIAIVIFGHYGGVGRHVQAIKNSMNTIEHGDLTHRAKEQGPSELADVARGLNRMLDSLERKNAELEVHRQHEQELATKLQFQEKMAAIGRVSSGIAHELGAPLTVIDGRARRLLKETSDPASQRQLEAIRGQVKRLTRIVQQLLNYTRQGQQQPQVVVIKHLVKEAIESIEHESTTAALQIDMIGDDTEVRGDEARLELALVNVLRNAIQVAEQRILVEWQVTDDAISLTVTDDGPGLPDDANVSTLIEPFYTTKQQGEGTGLGLAIVDNVMNEHGGTMCMENASSGGCRVCLRWPLGNSSKPSNEQNQGASS